MYETAVLVIWCSSVIAGMMVTMLMPHIFTESTGNRGEARPTGVYTFRRSLAKTENLDGLDWKSGITVAQVTAKT